MPEVAGRVIWVSPSFASGGFFDDGQPLLRIEPSDYREAVIQARAAAAREELRAARERAEADVARKEWGDLGGGEATPLTLREPQLAEAEAALEAARAALERAERNLDRTEIRAPYDGRVRHKQVDVGQYVTPGTPVATIYAVDYAEVRLPLADEELAFIDLPLDYWGDSGRGPGPEVVLSARFAGRAHRWEGHIVRTEGEIDRAQPDDSRRGTGQRSVRSKWKCRPAPAGGGNVRRGRHPGSRRGPRGRGPSRRTSGRRPAARRG